ncbi:hypothetical protein KIH27_20900 [Mycobacterium sp. M1]|uniref:Uncharacterized protein n=1 Tax=Mycolicibacter acidiphilus TaxID=2835306 RepID=A0ABS5RRB3_9MYCO|nr:hypothetical protein [Mycolicibacter acidiphilus]MBS9536046.1 hypothetical protein [Mycolicibacter acidiphilus]
MSGADITFEPPGWAGVLTQPPPTAVVAGPVGAPGVSPIDAAAAAFGAMTNADLPAVNSRIADDDADRRAHAAEAIEKFGANEDDAVAQFDDVGAGSDQMAAQLAGLAQGVVGMLGGALGSLGRLPQELMQAGQGALTPLLGAVQSLGQDGSGGLGDATLADEVDPVGVDVGDSGGGLGTGTTPAGDLGPAPVPVASLPTTPTAAMTSGPPATPAAAVGPGAGMGGVPLAGSAGAGGGVSKTNPPSEKRITAPGAPNGQPVKGRAPLPPNVAVTTGGKAGAPAVVKRRVLGGGGGI